VSDTTGDDSSNEAKFKKNHCSIFMCLKYNKMPKAPTWLRNGYDAVVYLRVGATFMGGE